MRYPTECYHILQKITEHFPNLRPAQQRGLALWVFGTILAGSGCQNAVIAAFSVLGGFDTVRQHLREWLYDGKDKAAPCRTQIYVSVCFGPLIRWILSWWQGKDLPLAIDPTLRRDEVVGLTVSLLYRGCAIPIAWHILPANTKGKWLPHILRLLRLVKRDIPAGMRVLVMADRGLWSPRLWKRIRDLKWHPLLRLQLAATFPPVGERRRPARELVPGPGHAWVGYGTAFKDAKVRRKGTLIVVWAEGEDEPWVLLTNLPPDKVGIWWYSLRIWVELGFRALKGIGFAWDKTRRVDPDRVARHWLVLAVAMVWVMAYGTRAEDAERQGVPPANLRSAPKLPVDAGQGAAKARRISVFLRGISCLRWQLPKGRLWRRLWLTPEHWPEPSTPFQIIYHHTFDPPLLCAPAIYLPL